MIQIATVRDVEAIQPICPKCYSNFRSIRGQIFPVGNPAGYRCDHDWHRGPNYLPDVLVLTVEDRQLLADLKVTF